MHKQTWLLLLLLNLVAGCTHLDQPKAITTKDGLLTLSPPALNDVTYQQGADSARDRTTGYESYIGWLDFSSSEQPQLAGMFSVEWMNIAPNPIDDPEDFYARATWYLDQYMKHEYQRRFDVAFQYAELKREHLMVGANPALRVVVYGPVGETRALGVLTVIGMGSLIVNVQVSYYLSETDKEQFEQAAPWHKYLKLVNSIRASEA